MAMEKPMAEVLRRRFRRSEPFTQQESDVCHRIASVLTNESFTAAANNAVPARPG
jgi:hypothetical protein